MAKKRRKIVHKHEPEQLFYVGVRDPMEVRRNILESSREAINFMQRLERIKKIREEKMHSVHQLRTDIKELRSLLNKLKQALPKTKLRFHIAAKRKTAFACKQCPATFTKKSDMKKHMKQHLAPMPQMEMPQMRQMPSKRGSSELELLEQELSEIEGKLEKL